MITIIKAAEKLQKNSAEKLQNHNRFHNVGFFGSFFVFKKSAFYDLG